MQQRRHRGGVQHRGGEALVAQAQCVVPQPWLVLAEQAGQADQGAHVAERFVGIANAQAVVFGQVLQLEAGAATVVALAPVDAFGAQCVHQA